MANTEKTTEILEFKIDQGAAITELEKLRKTMIGLKEEQTQLTAAYKKGDITVEEYAKEITRVDTLLKKVGDSHNTAQKAMAGVQSQTDKLIKSNQQLSKGLADAAKEINIAGVNINSLTQRMVSFVNPVTAVVGVVGALAAAYARSSVGAKDLEFAQNQLSYATTLVTDRLASLVSSTEDGEGAVSSFVDFGLRNLIAIAPGADLALRAFGVNMTEIANKSRDAAMAVEELNNLREEFALTQIEINKRTEENSGLLTDLANKEIPAQERLKAAQKIQENISRNISDRIGAINQEIAANEKIRDTIEDKGDLDLIINKLQAEKSALLATEEKQRERIQKQLNAILAAEEKETEQLRFQTSELERQARIATLERQLSPDVSPLEQLRKDTTTEVEITKNASSEMAKASEDLAKRVEAANKRRRESSAKVLEGEENNRDALRLFSSEAARLYQTINQDNKYFAAAQLAVDAGLTLSSIERNAAQLGPQAGPIYRAAAYLSAGASLAQAAKLIGTSAPGIQDLGQVFTSTSGQQYVIQNGEAVPLAEAQAKAARKQQISTDLSGAAGAIATGAAIGSVVPGIGTVAGAIAGGLAYGVKLLFRGFRRRRSGYAEGGWTGPGEMHDVAGVVHADEYVVPKSIKNTQAAQPHLKALENMRVRGYATGGYVGNVSSGNSMDLIRALSSIQVVATIKDIHQAEKRQATKMKIVTR